MNVGTAGIGTAGAAVLAVGFLYASAKDLQAREVTDRLWQVLGVAGAVLGALAVAPDGLGPIVLWAVVAALALEHLFPWDDALADAPRVTIPALEVGAYLAAIGVVGYAAARWGVGPSAVPVGVVAALATVVLARLLFEFGVLYGGADAKALIVSGLLVPIYAVPLVIAPSVEAPLLQVLPFSLSLLTDAALFAIAVPIVIAAQNVRRGEFTFPRGFTSYTLDVDELPRHFVWVRDPSLGEDTLADDAETSQEDTRRRVEIAQQLRAQGVRRVWVTPQLPFLVLMTAGAIAGLLAGNLLLDLFALL